MVARLSTPVRTVPDSPFDRAGGRAFISAHKFAGKRLPICHATGERATAPNCPANLRD